MQALVEQLCELWNGKAPNMSLFMLPDELVIEVLRNVSEPFRLPLVCTRFLDDNWIWWLTYTYWNHDRAFIYSFHNTQASSDQPYQQFWKKLGPEFFPYLPELNYRQLAGRSILVSNHSLRCGWSYDLDWTDAVRLPGREKVKRQRGRAGKQFGYAPVLLACSSVGSGYLDLTSKMTENMLTPMKDRVLEQLGTEMDPFASGWPGWEHMTGVTDNLELLAVAYGGSDVYWTRFSSAVTHVKKTYDNLIGVVLVTEIMQFDMHQFQRYILKCLQDVIPENFDILPILILKTESFLTRNHVKTAPYQMPNQFLWYPTDPYKDTTDFEVAKLPPTPTAIFPINEWDYGMRWLYFTRMSLQNHSQ